MQRELESAKEKVEKERVTKELAELKEEYAQMKKVSKEGRKERKMVELLQTQIFAPALIPLLLCVSSCV